MEVAKREYQYIQLWRSGITSALHARGPGFEPRCANFSQIYRIVQFRKKTSVGFEPMTLGFRVRALTTTPGRELLGWNLKKIDLGDGHFCQTESTILLRIYMQILKKIDMVLAMGDAHRIDFLKDLYVNS